MIRFRENDESGSRTRRLGISYMCTKCDKYGHNSRKCQSKEEDLDVLKRKVTYLYFYDYIDCISFMFVILINIIYLFLLY